MSGAVLITGAGTRVGAVLAKGLAAQGWEVAVHYNRSRSGARAICEQIIEQGGKASLVQANLFVPQDLNSLIKRASEALARPLTALINNASTFDADTAQSFSRATYDFHMDINLRAPLRLSQDFAAQLEGKKGSIINIIDQRVLAPKPEYFTYNIAKSALFAATKTLAQSFAPNIRVNGVGPGPTMRNKNQVDGEFEAELASTLLGNGSPANEILAAVTYLLSAQAVTGQMLAVDGGQHLS